jgi:adenylosuccinate lyase
MLSRTHGQPASPTTLGKEMANVAARLMRARARIAAVAHRQVQRRGRQLQRPPVGLPGLRLGGLQPRFIESLGLEFNPYTIQIEPHDAMAELFDASPAPTPSCSTLAATSGCTSRSATSSRS